MPYPTLGDDYVFSINPINKPELLEGAKAVYTLLVRLFLLNPGTYQSNPDMGIGLIKNYRYGTDEDIEDLKSNAQEQISTYLPGFETVSVDIDRDETQKILNINITLDGTPYQLNYNTELQSISSLY